MNGNDKIKYAIEELNRWVRHLDSTLWQISTVLLVGTSYALAKAFEMKGSNPTVIIIGVAFILIWFFYLLLLKDNAIKSQKYIHDINAFEKDLGINILPNEQGDFDKNLSKDFLSPFLLNIFSKIPNKHFYHIIVYITLLVWFPITVTLPLNIFRLIVRGSATSIIF